MNVTFEDLWNFTNRNWGLVALVVVAATVLGRPLQRALAQVADVVAEIPAMLAREVADRALAPAQPWTFERMSIATRRALETASRPIAGGRSVVERVARGALRNPLSRVDNSVRLWNGWLVAMLSEILGALTTGREFGRAQVNRGLEHLGSAPSQRIIGALIFAAASAGFIYADLIMLVNQNVQLIGSGSVPDSLKDYATGQTVASFLSFAMLGIVIFDLIGLTHVGPWSAHRGVGRSSLLAIATILLICLVIQSLAGSIWRADTVTPFLDGSSTVKEVGGTPVYGAVHQFMAALAQLANQPLMLLISVLVFAGALDIVFVLWLVIAATLYLSLAAVRLMASIVDKTLLPIATWLVGTILNGVVAFVLVLVVVVVAIAAGAAGGLLVGGVAIAATVWIGSVFLWKGLWTAVRAFLQLVAQATRLVFKVGDQIVEVITYPGRIVWNWLASWGAGRLRLRPIQ